MTYCMTAYLSRVRWLAGVQAAAKILDSDVSVADNKASTVQLLGRAVVGREGVGESTSLQAPNLQRDLEVLARLDHITILGVGDDGRNHVVLGRYETLSCDPISQAHLLHILRPRQTYGCRCRIPS
jgi:hypothetical protein